MQSPSSPPTLVETGPLLERVLATASSLGPRAIVVFDLDSTLLDNRPRQARILREFGRARGLSILEQAQASHWEGWDIRIAMRNAGLADSEIERHYGEVRTFWKERFFTSRYCVDDEPVAGAVDFVKRVLEAGAIVAYVTGRHEEMRTGTVDCFRRGGFPLPDQPPGRVHLLMKTLLEHHDDDWKVEAQDRLRALGEVIAVFDNEPTHVNGYRRAFPEALSVHLATDHSGRPVPLLDGVVSIRDFRGAAR